MTPKKFEFGKGQMLAQITIGTVPGYDHDNSKAWTLNGFTAWLQEFMDDRACDDNKKYASWLVFPAKTVYKKEWGAPVRGEDVFVLQAFYTSEYDKDISIANWRNNIKDCAKEIKSALCQSTVRVQFTESEVIIL